MGFLKTGIVLTLGSDMSGCRISDVILVLHYMFKKKLLSSTRYNLALKCYRSFLFDF